jgi:enoyl-CoA hydratase/carnithine racemase
MVLSSNPKPFHALSLEMIHVMQDVLENWYGSSSGCSNNSSSSRSSSIQAILLKSNPDGLKRPAFCAGGDVKSIYTSILLESDDDKQHAAHHHHRQQHGHGKPGLMSADFFRHEYSVNHALATVHESAYNNNTTTTTAK